MQPPSGTSAGQPLSAASQDTFSLAASIDELLAALKPGGESVRGSDDGSTAYTGMSHTWFSSMRQSWALPLVVYSGQGCVKSCPSCLTAACWLISHCQALPSCPAQSLCIKDGRCTPSSWQGLLSKINRVLACTWEEQIILYPIYDMTGGIFLLLA